MKIQLVNFVVQGLFFSMKLSGFMKKAIKFLLIELVGQCRNILPLVCGQYIPALTSHSGSLYTSPGWMSIRDNSLIVVKSKFCLNEPGLLLLTTIRGELMLTRVRLLFSAT